MGNQYTEIYADMTSETVNLVKNSSTSCYVIKVLIKTHMTTYMYTLMNIKFEYHIAIFYRKFTKLPLQTEISVGKKHSLKLWGPMWKNQRIYRLLRSPPCTKSIYKYLRDTKDVIRKIEQSKIPKHCLLVTIDCIEMVTNVLQKEVEQEIFEILSETNPEIYFPKMPPIQHMEALLLELILHRNCFSFYGKYYLQTA